jgi:hypothetical protein
LQPHPHPNKLIFGARATRSARAPSHGSQRPRRDAAAGQPRHKRACAWCHQPIPNAARRDARTCSKACRQAKARFRVAPAGEPDGSPRHFAYADPPYPGRAKRYYKKPEVNHRILINYLIDNYPDGWALSTSAATLPAILKLCPDNVRVCIWNRAPRPTRRIRAHNAYEVLIVAGGRPRQLPRGATLSDVLHWTGRQHSHPGALVGMKPAKFCEWMFRLLGAVQGDTLDDIFPGSGAVTRAWKLHAAGRDTSPPPLHGSQRWT